MKREAGVNGDWLPIPLKMRVKALSPFWKGLLFVCFLWLVLVFAFASLNPDKWFESILTAVFGVLAFSIFIVLFVSPVLFKSRIWEWNESAKKVIAEEKRIANQKGIERSNAVERYLNHPFSRFLFSLVVLYVTWLIAPIDKPNPHWKEWAAAGVGVAFAAYLLRETLVILAIIAVVCLFGYFAYGYVESLSVTGAIIVGAIIIAAAILHNGNRNKANRNSNNQE